MFSYSFAFVAFIGIKFEKINVSMYRSHCALFMMMEATRLYILMSTIAAYKLNFKCMQSKDSLIRKVVMILVFLFMKMAILGQMLGKEKLQVKRKQSVSMWLANILLI